MDKQKLKDRVLFELFLSPWTYVPPMVGVSVWFFSAAAGQSTGFFPAAIGFVLGVGFFFKRLLNPSEKMIARVQQELEEESAKERENALNLLHEQLSSEDRDERPESALADLRALASTFRSGVSWKKGLDAYSVLAMTQKVNELFEECINSLKETSNLQKDANEAQTPAVRKTILKRREALIKAVQGCVEKLTATLEGFEELSTSSGQDRTEKLTKLGEELTRQLEVSRRVDEDMRALGIRSRSTQPKHENPQRG